MRASRRPARSSPRSAFRPADRGRGNWRTAEEDAARALEYFGYVPAGLPALREAVAAHLGDLGLPTAADQVVITSGAQQAIDVVSRTLGPGAGSVLIENPTYPGAIAAFRGSSARLVPVPVDDEGLIVELVGLHAERRPGQLVYVVPAYQNRQASSSLTSAPGLRPLLTRAS
jgi:DNA-binding transcriptional MocR family regulator